MTIKAILLALFCCSNAFADGLASLNSAFFSMDGLNIRDDGTVIVDLAHSWDLTPDPNNQTVKVFSHRKTTPKSWINNSKVMFELNKDQTIRQISQTDTRESNTAEISGNGIQSFTRCEPYVPCLTVTKSLCDFLKQQLGASSYRDMSSRADACANMMVGGIPKAVITEVNASTIKNTPYISTIAPNTKTDFLDLTKLAAHDNGGLPKSSQWQLVAAACGDLEFTSSSSSVPSAIKFQTGTSSAVPAK